MIEFMIIAMPRSGTTWAANFFTTDITLCLHDPLWTHHYRDLDAIQSSKRLGVACTGLGFFPDWLNAHPAKKVILHRDFTEIRHSLARIGRPCWAQPMQLDKIQGLHAPWTDLFDNPEPIFNHLIGAGFDAERHALLRTFKLEAQHFAVDAELTQALLAEIGVTSCLSG